MLSYNLNVKELLLLCSQQGSSMVNGIDDVYGRMSNDKKNAEMELAWFSLEKKGYIESDFDGNSVVDEKLLHLINTCTQARQLILVSIKERKSDCSKLNYYILNDHMVEIKIQAEECSMRAVLKPEMLENIKSFLPTIQEITGFEGGQISQKRLRAIKAMVQQGQRVAAKKYLLQDVSEEAADLILNVFKQNGSIYSIVAVNHAANENTVQSLQYITGKNGCMKLVSKMEKLESEIEFVPLKDKEVVHFIENVCGRQYGRVRDFDII
jgi:hypothetical protein